MRQVTSELQTSGSTSTIYKIVPGVVGTKPVWNISVNVNVFCAWLLTPTDHLQRQVISKLQTGCSISAIYKIVPGAVGTKPVWNISVNINVFVYLIVLHLGDNNLGKNSDFRGPGV